MFIEIVCSKCGDTAKKLEGRSKFPDLCKKCSNVSFAMESSSKNPEKVKEHKRKHCKNNPEKVLDSKRRSRIKHKVLANERARNRRIENPEKTCKASRKHYAKNREKLLADAHRFRVEHPEIVREYYLRGYAKKKNFDRYASECRKRRARKLNALGDHTTKQVQAVFDRQGGKCYDCGKVEKLTIGHKNPLSIGGSDDISNIIGQCFPCNAKQGSKVHPDATLSLFDRVTR